MPGKAGEDDEFEEVDLDDLEVIVDEVEEVLLHLESTYPPPLDAPTVTRIDPEVSDMLEGVFQGLTVPSIAPPPSTIPAPEPPSHTGDEDLDDRPTDRPPPIDDPDEAEFRAFMKLVRRNAKPP